MLTILFDVVLFFTMILVLCIILWVGLLALLFIIGVVGCILNVIGSALKYVLSWLFGLLEKAGSE